MNRSTPLLAFALCVATLGFSAGAQAGDAQTLPELGSDSGKSVVQDALAQDAVCTKCHDEYDGQAMSLYKTRHGVRADTRAPTCQSCHGASEDHVQNTTKASPRPLTQVVFGAKSKDNPASTAATQNEACMGCHESGMRMHWKGSQHEIQGGACTDCHKVHAGDDPVMNKVAQTEVCLTCHKAKRAELHRPSSHPILEGKTACSDCHNPHGSNGPTLLVGATLNETCYTCHAEKRGPFLWEHEPVREDCSICHKPHGSVNESLLKNRAPWLCQQCHLEQFHPSTAYSGTGLPGATTPSGAQQLLGKNCMNCHVQVHGSNHPSGPRKTR